MRSSANSTIEKINNSTKLNFALPSAEQWKYAAKGGNKSQNYTYCGSNTPGDVAWYSANASSRQIVKTKAPNELGIYDMSGNVAEMINSTSNYYYAYGGDYSSASSNITKTSCQEIYYNNSYNNVGFRLILTCP
jgi:formylglycine-generating enzyme required for sulfatase activity